MNNATQTGWAYFKCNTNEQVGPTFKSRKAAVKQSWSLGCDAGCFIELRWVA